MSLKKKYFKNNQFCKVTFRVAKEAAKGASSINIAGDFNNWSILDNPMKKLKNGDFTATLDLEANRQYQFRYLLDEKIWENEWEADKYVRSEYGNCENSVVIV